MHELARTFLTYKMTAGKLKVDANGNVSKITNESGHYTSIRTNEQWSGRFRKSK